MKTPLSAISKPSKEAMKRRTFIRRSVFAACGMLLSPAASVFGATGGIWKNGMPILDARMRPPYKTLQNAFLYKGYDSPESVDFREQMGLGVSRAARERSMDAMLEEMDALNIKCGVVCTRVTDGGSNEELLKLLKAYPGRFLGVPHIEPAKGQQALEDIEKYAIKGPCSGIYLERDFRMEKIVMHADDKRMDPIWDLCQQKEVPVVLQYGGGKNTTEYFTPTDIDHIMARFPKSRIMISHGGWPQSMPFIHQAYKHKGVFLAPGSYFYGWPGSQDYVTAANTILRDKMIFGSDFPLYNLQDAVRLYTEHINDRALPKIMYENGARFFKLA